MGYEKTDWTCGALCRNRDAGYAFYDKSVRRTGFNNIVTVNRI